MKYLFYDDYSEGAHPAVLDYIAKNNTDQQIGYGLDEYSKLAAQRIQQKLGTDADVHFVSGGTQANLIAFSCMLLPYQAVISPTTGHINIHEAGAIEATGHKIIACPTDDGKLTPEDIERVMSEHLDEHQVQPKAVFITQATELGTVYTPSELKALIEVARKHGLYAYLDGARLAVALAAEQSKMSLSELGGLDLDMFYIGGTKNGALCGEAMVIKNEQLKNNFRFHLKQRGALLAKGRLLGQQFARLFEDDLWLELGQQSNAMAAKLASDLESLGIKLAHKQSTNQIFPILPTSVVEKLKKDYGFHLWQKVDEKHSMVRLVCSFATEEKNINEFIADLKLCLNE